jgi:hypothetical protein
MVDGSSMHQLLYVISSCLQNCCFAALIAWLYGQRQNPLQPDAKS